MRLFGQLPWFIATFAGDPEDELAKATICFCWDSDLVAAVSGGLSGTLVELVCMLPAWCSGTGLWKAEQVAEILQGRDLDRGGERSFAFRTADGAIRYGAFLQLAGPQLVDLASIATIHAPSGCSPHEPA